MKGGFIYLVIDKLVPALEKQGKQMWVPPHPSPTPSYSPSLLTFRFQSGLPLGGSEGRPGHADSQKGQQDSGQEPGPRGHPAIGGQRSPYPPSPPPPGHWSHLRGSAQPSTAAGLACHSPEFTQSPGLGGKGKKLGDRLKRQKCERQQGERTRRQI